MPILDGYNVAVTDRAGRELDHYSVRHEGPNALSCFIASEAGMEFKIQYQDESDDGWLMRVVVSIDGQFLACRDAHPRGSVSIGTTRTSATTEATFQFAPVQLVDDDEINPLQNTGSQLNLHDIGLIEVKLNRARKEQRHRPNRHYVDRPNRLLEARPISEKSKKGGHHITCLGTTRSSFWRPSTGHKERVVSIDPNRHPYKYFRIYYRPKEILMAEGILPKPKLAASQLSGRERVEYDGHPNYPDADQGDVHPSSSHTRGDEASRTRREERVPSDRRVEQTIYRTPRDPWPPMVDGTLHPQDRAAYSVPREVPEMYLPRLPAQYALPAKPAVHNSQTPGNNSTAYSNNRAESSGQHSGPQSNARQSTNYGSNTSLADSDARSTQLKADPSTPYKKPPPEVIDLTYLSDSD